VCDAAERKFYNSILLRANVLYVRVVIKANFAITILIFPYHRFRILIRINSASLSFVSGFYCVVHLKYTESHKNLFPAHTRTHIFSSFLLLSCPVYFIQCACIPVMLTFNFRTNVSEAVQVASRCLVFHFPRFLQTGSILFT